MHLRGVDFATAEEQMFDVKYLRRDICDNLDEDSDDIADGDDDPFGYMPQLEPSNILL